MKDETSISAILKVDKSAQDSVNNYTKAVAKLNSEIEALQKNMAKTGQLDAPHLKLIDQKRRQLSELQSGGRAGYASKAYQEAQISALIDRAMSKSHRGRVLAKGESISMFSKEDQKLIQKAQSIIANPAYMAQNIHGPHKHSRREKFLLNAQQSEKLLQENIKQAQAAAKAEQARLDKHSRRMEKQARDKHNAEMKDISDRAKRRRTADHKADQAETAYRKRARVGSRPQSSSAARTAREEAEIQKLYAKARKNGGNFMGGADISQQPAHIQKRWKKVQADLSHEGFIQGSPRERLAWQRNVAAQGQIMQKQLANQKAIEAALKETAQKEKQRSKATAKTTRRKPMMTDAENASQSRRMSRERLFGDGGAGLFRTQGALLANYALMGAGVGGLSATLAFTIELDKSFKQLQSIVRLTDQEMVGLEETLINVSEATKFTATEVANASITLGQAGFSKDQIEKAIKPITLFATAVGTDLASAVDLATSVMGVFNMNATQMGDTVNIMTTAINKSKLTMDKLSLGLQYSGNLAAQAGLDFKEVVALLGAMANSGIRAGSMLGTGFRQVLIALQAPTDKFKAKLRELGLSVSDIDVRTHGMVNVLKTLTKAGFTSADAMQVLQTRSASAFSAMVNNVSVADELTVAMGATESAAEANTIQMTALANQWARLKSIALSIGAEGLSPMRETFTNILKSTADILSNIKQMEGIGTALGIAGSVAGGVILVKTMKWLGGLLAGLVAGGGFRGTSLATGLAGPTMTKGTAMQRSLAGMSMGRMALRALPYVGTAAALYSVGSGMFDSDGGQRTISEGFRTDVNAAQGRYESHEKDINRVDEALAKIYARGGLSNDQMEAYLLEVEASFKDLYLTLTDVSGGTKAAIAELKNLKQELVRKATEENKLTQAGQIKLAGSQIKELDGAFGQSFLPYRSERTGQSQLESLDPRLQTVLLNAESLRGMKRPQNLEEARAFQRHIIQTQGLAADLVLGGGFPEGSSNAQYLSDVTGRLSDVRGLSGNLIASYADINKTKKEGRILSETSHLNDLFGEGIASAQLRFTQSQTDPIFKKSKSFLEKSTKAGEIANNTEEFVAALIAEIEGSKMPDGSAISASAVSKTISPLLSLSGQARTFLTQKRTDAEPELRAGYEGDIYAKNKEMNVLRRRINSTTSTEELRTLTDTAKSLAAEIEELVFQKAIIVVDATSAAFDNAKRSKTEATKSRKGKLEHLYRVNSDRLEANALAASLFNGDGGYTTGSSSRVGDMEFSKAIKSRHQGSAELMKGRYEEALAAMSLLDSESNVHGNKAHYQLRRYNDGGLRDNVRITSAKQALESLRLLEQSKGNAFQARIAAKNKLIFDPDAGLEFRREADQKILDTELPGTRAYREAETRQKKLDSEIEKLKQDIRELEVDQMEMVASSQQDINELIDESSLLGMSRSDFNDERRRQIKAELRGGTYRTDAGNTHSFDGQQVGVFGQVIEQTNAQFQGFDAMTESVLALQSVVDGLGEHVAAAMFEFVTGAESAEDAMKNMLRGILNSIAQAASQMVANQVIMALFSSLGGMFGGGGTGMAGSPSSYGSSFRTAFNGGYVGAFNNGGLVSSGKTQRDSTFAKVAKGEFIVRKEAVDAVGLESMHQLNNLTKSSAKSRAAARGVANRASDVVVPKTETNVYLLDKTSPPPAMGPNDVVAVVNDNIIRSGQTKTLIKKVATGEL